MKRILILLLFSVFFHAFGQKGNTLMPPRVDERVELLSIVFRLAGNHEYNSRRFKLYTDKIYEHYTPYKDHELIHFAKRLRKENGVSFDAVMSMAIHLDSGFNPLVKFTDKVPDKRWGQENAKKFVQLLQQFYNDSKSEQFFKVNSILYKHLNQRFLPIYKNLDLAWYETFYGKEPGEIFNIVIGLGNGGASYGPSIEYPNVEREVYAIMKTGYTDSAGMAVFPVNNYLPTLLHEFNHSFVNYLLEKNPDSFEQNGKILYEAVKHEMQSLAYGDWQIMVNESLVRAAVIQYMKDHDFAPTTIEDEINKQLNKGFLWINELIKELEMYTNQRDQYQTLEAFMPKLANAYSHYATNINTYVDEFNKKRPKIVSISGLSNGAQNVKPTLKRITVNFDRELSGKGYSINYGNKGKDAYPEIENITYSDDRKSIMIDWQLEHKKEYQLVLTGLAFKSDHGISIKNYEINFKTE